MTLAAFDNYVSVAVYTFLEEGLSLGLSDADLFAEKERNRYDSYDLAYRSKDNDSGYLEWEFDFEQDRDHKVLQFNKSDRQACLNPAEDYASVLPQIRRASLTLYKRTQSSDVCRASVNFSPDIDPRTGDYIWLSRADRSSLTPEEIRLSDIVDKLGCGNLEIKGDLIRAMLELYLNQHDEAVK